MLSEYDKLPDKTDALLIATPKSETHQILLKAFELGIQNIWVQQHSETKDTRRIVMQYNQEIISHKCIMMFAQPLKGFHYFHRSLTGLFGQLPR